MLRRSPTRHSITSQAMPTRDWPHYLLQQAQPHKERIATSLAQDLGADPKPVRAPADIMGNQGGAVRS